MSDKCVTWKLSEFQNLIPSYCNETKLIQLILIYKFPESSQYPPDDCLKASFFHQGFLMPAVTSVGLVGNLLSIRVLRSPNIDMKVNIVTIFEETPVILFFFFKVMWCDCDLLG